MTLNSQLCSLAFFLGFKEIEMDLGLLIRPNFSVVELSEDGENAAALFSLKHGLLK